MIPNIQQPVVRAEQYQPVSFIIPAHNESKYLNATLGALIAAAEELLQCYEIIVVNDDSTDDTGKIATQWNAKVIDVKLRNIGAVRNAGAAAAVNQWLVFIDADTVVPKATLRGTLQSLANGCVGGGAFVRLDDVTGIAWHKMLMYYAVSLIWQTFGRWAAGCYMFCDRTSFEDFGGFDEQYFAAEELFFSRALKSRGKFQLIREPVLTSARKFHGYSTQQIFSLLTVSLRWLQGENPLQSQRGLEIWYDDDR